MDFTLKKYTQLLDAFLCSGYEFMTFEDYCSCAKELADKKLVIFRHDVDLKAENALQVAKIEAEKGIRSTYYFRTLASSNKPNVIKQIVALGHEVGYHYEDFSFCNGDAEKAKHLFLKNLNYFRQFYPVKTICMHGSPRSRFDNKDLWKSFDYQSCGIVGEPYFDMDFDEKLEIESVTTFFIFGAWLLSVIIYVFTIYHPHPLPPLIASFSILEIMSLNISKPNS